MKKVIGFRIIPNGFRYCIIQHNDDGTFEFLNKNSENKVMLPVGLLEMESYAWVKQEFSRIIDANPDVSAIGLKHNENIKTCYSKLKQTMFFDAAITLVALDKHIEIIHFVYNQIGCNKNNVKQMAEKFVGKTTKYWDEKISDAIMVAKKML